MTDSQPNDPGWFYVGAIVQKAFVEADEFGTEAAAATAVVVSIATSMGIGCPPPRPVVFTPITHFST